MATINNSLVGFPPLQAQALKGTFASLSGSQTLSGNVTLTGKFTHGTVVQPASATLSPAAGSANVCLVTIQLKDASGTNLAHTVPMHVYLSDSATGAGVTATTASGAVAAGASGSDIVDLTSKKVKYVLTDATGKYILSITDTAKTGFYVVVATNGGVTVSSQLVTGNYG